MFCVVTYDIPDDRRRTKVANILEDFGDRVQYSVFEMELNGVDQLATLQGRLRAAIRVQDDGVRMYVLCRNCRSKVAILGQGTLYEDKDVHII